jgi:hypothetical protein
MKKVFNIIWKSLLTGVGYIIALVIGGMIVRLTGLSLPEAKDAQTIPIWPFAGGIIVGLFLGPIATSMITSKRRHIVIWSTVIFFNLISVAIEGHFFAPELVDNLLLGQIIQLILAAFVTGWLITILFAPKETTVTISTTQRSLFSWIWRFITSALAYVVFYFFFGAINYTLVTKPYYETHVGGLTAPSPETVLMVELIRGALIVLSVLPFLLSKRMNKKRSVIFTGLILFSVGGLVPLTMQVDILPFMLLVASAIEIFFQNFLTGAVTAILLGQSE